MSSLNLASLPPAGAPIHPSSGAPADAPRRAPAADLSAPPEATAEAKDERGFFDRIWGKDGFSFGALIDIINPLQHIPVVGTVYRAITGDTIGPASRIAGGTLFGGVIGLIASSIDTAVKEETGRDIGQHVLAMRDDDGVKRDVTTPTGRPERDSVLYAGDFTPRDSIALPIPAPATMLAQAEPAAPAASAPQQAAASAISPAAISGAAVPQAAPQLASAPAQSAMRASSVQHEAANGVGGAPVPLSSNVSRGMRGANLPTPQSLAADPALLRQMQTTRGPSNAIRAKSEAAAGPVPSFLDYTPKNAALRSVDADAPAETTANNKVQPVSAAAVPEVPADLISRMNMALEKYQTMQRVTDRPAVNIAQ
ncbi:MAG TPA: hypothetical protein VFS04_07195 [Alphaproteobacteria bacterium]|nr:hypothetical protein [Alphaproteobacteria bacterium]